MLYANTIRIQTALAFWANISDIWCLQCRVFRGVFTEWLIQNDISTQGDVNNTYANSCSKQWYSKENRKWLFESAEWLITLCSSFGLIHRLNDKKKPLFRSWWSGVETTNNSMEVFVYVSQAGEYIIQFSSHSNQSRGYLGVFVFDPETWRYNSFFLHQTSVVKLKKILLFAILYLVPGCEQFVNFRSHLV